MKHIIISCCNDCGLSSYNPIDGLWYCAHKLVRDKGLSVNITYIDGRPHIHGVSRRCPLIKEAITYQLAEGVRFID